MAPRENGNIYLVIFGIAHLALFAGEIAIAYRDIGTLECVTFTASLAVSPFGWLLTLAYTNLAVGLAYFGYGVASFYRDIHEFGTGLTWLFVISNATRIAFIVVSGLVLWRDPDPDCYDTGMLKVMLADFIISCTIITWFFLKKLFGNGNLVTVGIQI